MAAMVVVLLVEVPEDAARMAVARAPVAPAAQVAVPQVAEAQVQLAAMEAAQVQARLEPTAPQILPVRKAAALAHRLTRTR